MHVPLLVETIQMLENDVFLTAIDINEKVNLIKENLKRVGKMQK